MPLPRLASSENVFTSVLAKDRALADASHYQQVWRAFPSGTPRILYADVAGLLEQARSAMSSTELESFNQAAGAYLSPIQTVALGSWPLKNGVTQSTLIVFIGDSNP